MRVLGIVGRGRNRLAERLVARLSDRGDVAVVATDETGPEDRPGGRYRDAGAVRTTSVAGGDWVTAGAGGTLSDRLDRLAPVADYALVTGRPEADIETVALGGADHDGPTVVEAAVPDGVDIDSVLDALSAQDPHETLESLVASVKTAESSEYAGAIATFTGRVRARDGPEDVATEYLEFERYDEVAAEQTAAIRDDLEAREGVYEVRLHHRTGTVEAEEDIVFVVVLAGHREEAFETVEDGIDRLKEEVPLFKKEVTVDDEFWAHEPDFG